jgi:thioredoxin-related protein
MKPFFILVFAFLSLSVTGNLSAFAQPKENNGIKWMTIEEAEAACKKKPKKIFIDVFTSWCGWCKKMDAGTFQDPDVVTYVNENYYAVKLDAESQDNIIFKDKVFKHNPQRQVNELAIMLLNGQMSYPTTVYLDEKLNVIQSMGGYLDAGQFNFILHFFAEGVYKKKKSLEDFKAEYYGRKP